MGRFHLIGLLAILAACGQAKESPTQEFDLCNCNSWDRGERDMELSQRCIDACLEKFGPQLEGMEEWFRDHCNPLDEKEDTQDHFTHHSTGLSQG
ncbi:MAG: hypothetical protein AAFQ98_07890 [Bacteroidota bacterium]